MEYEEAELSREVKKRVMGLVDPVARVRYESLLSLSNLLLPTCMCQSHLCSNHTDCGQVSVDKTKSHKLVDAIVIKAILRRVSDSLEKCRLLAVQILLGLVLCGAHESIYELTAFRDPNLIPIRAFYHPDVKTQYLALLASDKSVSVRRELLQTVANWLQHLCERKEHEVRLLPYVVSALNDPNPQIQGLAFNLMEDLGEQYEVENESEVTDVKHYLPEDALTNSNSIDGEPLAPPFKCRPCLGARILVRSCLGLLLHAIGADLQAWTSGTKELAANFLYTILIFAEENATMHLQALIIMLIKGLKDTLITDKMFKCAKLLGHFVDPSAYLPILLPQITGEVFGDITSEQAGKGIKLLSSFMQGSSPTVLTVHIPDICSTITEQEFLTSLNQEVAEGMVMLCKQMVVALGEECEETLSVLWILVNSVAVAEVCKRPTVEAENVLEELAKASNYSSTEAFLATYTTRLINLLRHPGLWAGWSLEFFIVSKLLECTTLADHYTAEKLLDYLEYFTTSTEQEIKLRLLVALESVLTKAPTKSIRAGNKDAILEGFVLSCINSGNALLQPTSRVIRLLITSNHWKDVPISLKHLSQEIRG